MHNGVRMGVPVCCVYGTCDGWSDLPRPEAPGDVVVAPSSAPPCPRREAPAGLASLTFKERRVAMKPSSLLLEEVEEAELFLTNDGRGLRLGFCCAAEAKYDAGLKDRLAIL